MKLDPPARIEELPIPKDSRPTSAWPDQMLEMAAHIGPYRTLQLVDVLGGQTVIVPRDPERNRMRTIIGEDGAEIMSRIYGLERIEMPTAHHALNEARRAPILAAIRTGKMTIAAAVPILRMKRGYISRLVNHSDEGDTAVPLLPRKKRDTTTQIEMFETD